MKDYESVLIFKDNCTPNDIDSVINKIRKYIDDNGKVMLVKYMGYKELAYEIKGYKKAHYYQIDFLMNEKNIADMCKFIKSMAQKHANNGWNCVTNEIVYAWAVMYYSLPNKLLKIDEPKKNNAKSNKTKTENTNKNNVISIEDAKKELEEKKQTQQISLFGGVA